MSAPAKAEVEAAPATAGRVRSLFGEGWGWISGVKLAVILILLLWPVLYSSLSTGQHILGIMTQAGLYCILTLSVGLVLGQAGQLSFGHVAFYGIGAYTCGLLVYKLHVPTFGAWVAGAAAAGIVAALIGRPVLKLKYFYLALATMALGQIFLAVVFEWKWGGASNGFGRVAPLNIFGFHFDSPLRQYYMVWVVAILILLFLARLLKYRVGRAIPRTAVGKSSRRRRPCRRRAIGKRNCGLRSI